MPYFNFKQTYAELPKDLYDPVQIEPVSDPKFILFNDTLMEALNIDSEIKQHPELLSGNAVPDGALPLAHAYAGHQFGNFTMLGDGRAVVLGEHEVNDQLFDIQLKGSGRTAFSRMGDGRAPLGPMLREYIISEAMHALNIPTTRSLAVVTTGDTVFRETKQPGAILTRIAKSNIRVGTYEYAARTSREVLEALVQYTIDRHYPEINREENKAIALFEAVIKKQAALIAKWQSIGFVHGVMNTDNMSISGETIDYGPCAFMDEYNPATVFSSIDVNGRYQYQNQPGIGQWNLARFAETLLPLLDEDEETSMSIAQRLLGDYEQYYAEAFLKEMGMKIGIKEIRKDNEADEGLILDLLTMLEQYSTDYTSFFYHLSKKDTETALHVHHDFKQWYERWHQRIQEEAAPYEVMKQHNPGVIPRNHLVEAALNDAVIAGDYTELNALIEAVTNPYDDDHDQKYYEPPAPTDRVFQTFCGT